MTARVDYWCIGILLLSLTLNVYCLDWGLPNGNESWAADALGPVTVLGIVHRSFSEWNSGWFYFKYPLGYPFLLAVVFFPYLGYLYVDGGWRGPSTTYPHGFVDPEHTLFVLALLGRALSVAFALGTVALTYAIGRRLFGRVAARLSACFVATAYPVIYYAHTTNLDAGYLFWLMLALYCALVASESERSLPWLGLGFAAAMAVSTKEQGFAFLLPLPILALLPHARARGWVRVCISPPVLQMVAVAVVTVLLANNAVFNPLGFVGRIAYLLGRPLQPVAARLAPVEFAWWKGAKEWTYLAQLWDGLESALGMPLATLAVAAAGSMIWSPRAMSWLLAPALAHFYLSLRGLELIALRYVLPLIVIAALLAAGLLARLYVQTRTGAARGAIAALALILVVLGLVRGIELDWLLRTDSRYQAESWMRGHLRTGAKVEVYQKPVYLPRFPASVTVHQVPIERRSVDGVDRREPDMIVLSSASRKSITHRWNPDWRATRTLLLPVAPAVEFLNRLQDGILPYRRVVSFGQKPRLLQLRVTSLAPEITIYERDVRSD